MEQHESNKDKKREKTYEYPWYTTCSLNERKKTETCLSKEK
jgi:hypothetical protein